MIFLNNNNHKKNWHGLRWKVWKTFIDGSRLWEASSAPLGILSIEIFFLNEKHRTRARWWKWERLDYEDVLFRPSLYDPKVHILFGIIFSHLCCHHSPSVWFTLRGNDLSGDHISVSQGKCFGRNITNQKHNPLSNVCVFYSISETLISREYDFAMFIFEGGKCLLFTKTFVFI